MILATSTVTSSRESIIGDALRSMAHVSNLAVIVDIGIQDGTLNVARKVMGDRVRVVQASDTLSMAAWRNIGLEEATRLGATWACQLDTDERIHIRKGFDLLGYLASEKEDCVLTRDSTRAYSKERFFRLPATIQWSGHCHERSSTGAVSLCEQVTFSELPKTQKTLEERFKFIRSEMKAAVQADPLDSRSWFHLGDALAGLGDMLKALEAFQKCADLRRDPFEAAFACFRSATILNTLGRFQEGIYTCALGLSIHSGCAELAWWAGFLCLRLKQPIQAICWARMAIVNGCVEGIGVSIPRYFYRSPVGLWEGPYQVLELAQEALGNHESAALAKRCAAKAEKMRLAL
jgi:tetratricopeptide (TPR) repeat protein